MNPLQHLGQARRVIGLALGTLATATILSLLPPLLSAPPVHAQLDPGCRRQGTERVCRRATDDWAKTIAEPGGPADSEPRANLHEIFHADGRKVGEVFVAREPGAGTYVEHWVMFDTFEYPDAIRPADVQPYADEQDFLQHVPFGPGYRYARWDVVEQSRIPGR